MGILLFLLGAVCMILVIASARMYDESKQHSTSNYINEPQKSTFYTEVWVGSRHYHEYLVDTGASITTVPEKFMQKLLKEKQAFFVEDGLVNTAESKNVKTKKYIVKSIQVGGCLVPDQEVMVIIKGRKDLYILGMNTLGDMGISKKNPFRINFSHCY